MLKHWFCLNAYKLNLIDCIELASPFLRLSDTFNFTSNWSVIDNVRSNLQAKKTMWVVSESIDIPRVKKTPGICEFVSSALDKPKTFRQFQLSNKLVSKRQFKEQFTSREKQLNNVSCQWKYGYTKSKRKRYLWLCIFCPW